jgi:protein-disulfide isomerase
MLVLSGAIFGSALWFTIVQKWFIGSFCTYCIITHTTGFLLSILIIWQAIQQRAGPPSEIKHSDFTNSQSGPQLHSPRIIQTIHALGLASIGLILAGLLAVAQFSFTYSDSHYSDELQSGNAGVDYLNTPIIGSPDALYKVTLLFDYQCAHCQKIHFMLHEATRIYDNKLAFVLCPTPLEKSCNAFVTKDADAFKNSCEIARISLAVWLARREAFYDFENWMFTYESGNAWQPRSIQNTRAKAVELVGKARFDAAFSDPWIENYIQNSIRLFGQTVQNGQGGIPKLIFGSSFIIPEPYNVEDLILTLQHNLGVPKP